MTQTPTAFPHLETMSERRRSGAWMWWVVGLVLALVVGLGAGFWIGSATNDSDGLASDSVVEVIDDNIRAMVERDTRALEATYTEDAVLTDMINGSTWRGARAIAEAYTSVPTGISQLTRTSDVIRSGAFYTNSFTYYTGRGVAVWHIVDGKISHQWTIGH